MKGTKVKLHDGNGGWVPAIVTSDPDENEKVWVVAFPGPARDDEELQGVANDVLAAPGTGRYEYEHL